MWWWVTLRLLRLTIVFSQSNRENFFHQHNEQLKNTNFNFELYRIVFAKGFLNDSCDVSAIIDVNSINIISTFMFHSLFNVYDCFFLCSDSKWFRYCAKVNLIYEVWNFSFLQQKRFVYSSQILYLNKKLKSLLSSKWQR